MYPKKMTFGSMIALGLVAASPLVTHAFEINRASVAAGGAQAHGASLHTALSADGRYLAFDSDAQDLVPGDTRTNTDVFVRDLHAGTIERVSVSSDGEEGKGDSYVPSISADGRYVVFESTAWNLVPNDRNVQADVFVHDRTTRKTTRLSVAPGGGDSDGTSYAAKISADGRFVAFPSDATNLVPDDRNGLSDIFVADRETGEVTRVSIAANGGDPDGDSLFPSISSDGRFVAFQTSAQNIVPLPNFGLASVLVTDRTTGKTTEVSKDYGGLKPAISGDGRYVAYEDGFRHIVLADRVRNTFERIDVTRETTRCGRPGNWFGCWTSEGGSTNPAISADGSIVTFESRTMQLVFENPYHGRQVYVADRTRGTLRRVSVDRFGMQGDSCSTQPSISADGSAIAYKSTATNLVEGDTNGTADVYLVEQPCRSGGRVTRTGAASSGGLKASHCSWSY